MAARTSLPHLVKIFALVVYCCSYNANAEVYRHQDSEGKWHFSDKAPTYQRASQNSRQPAPASTTDHKDLQHLLTTKIQPRNIVETASMAVVGIQTKLGNGSGFFATSDGHIITNRHVVRPNVKSDDAEAELARVQQRLEMTKVSLDRRNRELNTAWKDLRADSAQIQKLDKNSAQAKTYATRKRELELYQRDFDQGEADYIRSKQEYEKNSKEYRWRQSMAGVSRNFKVILKDQTELNAKLVYVSKQYDLAVLKIDGYKTPHLLGSSPNDIAQGTPVYAIGSPLGQRDSVTSGVLTSIRPDVVITDTQILPGNSGGPLINAAGEVIAINTLKFSQVRGGDGFGHSIPYPIAQQALSAYLR